MYLAQERREVSSFLEYGIIFSDAIKCGGFLD